MIAPRRRTRPRPASRRQPRSMISRPAASSRSMKRAPKVTGSRTSQRVGAGRRWSRLPGRRLGAWAIGLVWLAGLAACGGPQHTADGGGSAGHDPAPLTNVNKETPIEQRRDAACDHLGPKLTACAVDDARANLAAGKTTKQQFDQDTAPDIQRAN